MPRPRSLREELFRLSSPDDQLLLAVALCLTDRQVRVSGPIVGVTSADLWDWLQTRTGNRRGHPNIDHKWNSLRAVQAALRRLERRKLVRETPSESEWTSALLWRPTEAAGKYLAKKRLFADTGAQLNRATGRHRPGR